MQFTEQQISAVAHVLSDRAAGNCGVHKEDNWDIYSDHYLEDAKAALAAASAAALQVVADERAFTEVMSKAMDDASMAGSYTCLDNSRFSINHVMFLAALAAAPVQAQEPFAYMIVDDEGKPLFERGSMASSKAELEAELEGLNSHDYEWPFVIIPVYRAPVQPVAVPDGPKLSDLELNHAFDYVTKPWACVRNEDISRSRAYFKAGYKYAFESEPHSQMSSDDIAAPAAQGDGKELTDVKLMELAETYFYQIEAETMDARILSFYRAAIAAKAAS